MSIFIKSPRRAFFIVLAVLMAFSASGAAPQAAAAEFDIDGPRVLLRRLQYCLHCGSALLVTRVHPGVLVRCPDCGREQPRLADKHTLTQLYQLCRLCAFPLDSRGHSPGEAVECGNCHTRQALSGDAFPTGGGVDGIGSVPGFPPGSGRKTLLFSPDHPDTLITPIPLDDPSMADLPMPFPAVAARPIPRPPERPLVEPPPPPATAIPEPAPAGTTAGEPAVDAALAVPAVSVDLFGGAPARPARAPDAHQGETVAARVDGRPIFASEVRRVAMPILERLRQAAGPEDAAVAAERERTLRREVLNRLIDRELVVGEALRTGHKPDPDVVRRRESELASVLAGSGTDLRREAEREVIMADMRRRFAERPVSVSPEALRAYYRDHAAEMTRPRLLALAPLAVYQDRSGRADRRHYREIAREISRRLELGEAFDDLRERHDEFAHSTGGMPSAPALLPETAYGSQILELAGGLRKGAVFGPLFQDGMAVFGKVVDERPAGPPPFAQVEKEILARLEAGETEKGLDGWLKELRRKARIEILREP